MSDVQPLHAEALVRFSPDYPPPDFFDPVIEAYKKDVDRSILRENLKMTVEERYQKYKSFLQSRAAWVGAAARDTTRRPTAQISGDAQ